MQDKKTKGIAYVVKQRFYNIDYCDDIFLNRTEAVSFKNKLNSESELTQKEKKEIGYEVVKVELNLI